MSLTTFIKEEQVRNNMDDLYDKPDFDLTNDMIAPPISENPRLIGTAFDYLLRFYLEYKNQNVETRPWVAARVVSKIANAPEEEIMHSETKLEDFTKAMSAFSSAKEEYERYQETGELNDNLLKSVLDLARLDFIARSNQFPEDLEKYNKSDIEDLQNLYEAIPKEKFITENEVLLNPIFGNASRLVGGADADLIIERTLIDIKTVKSSNLRRVDWRQLIGYSVLADLDPNSPSLNSVGLYYSRFGELWTTGTDIIYENDEYTKFRDWFKDHASS